MSTPLPIYYNPLTGYLHELRGTRKFLMWERYIFGGGTRFFSDAHTVIYNLGFEISSADPMFLQLIRVDQPPELFPFIHYDHVLTTYSVYKECNKYSCWSLTPVLWGDVSTRPVPNLANKLFKS